MNIYINHIFGHFPREKFNNQELIKETQLESTDEWIQKHTGIKSRHIMTEQEGSRTGFSLANELIKDIKNKIAINTSPLPVALLKISFET